MGSRARTLRTAVLIAAIGAVLWVDGAAGQAGSAPPLEKRSFIRGAGGPNQLVVGFTVPGAYDASFILLDLIQPTFVTSASIDGVGCQIFQTFDGRAALSCPGPLPASSSHIVVIETAERYPTGGGVRLGGATTGNEPIEQVDVEGPGESAPTGPDIGVEITGPTTALVGSDVDYTLTVRNVGTAPTPGPVTILIRTRGWSAVHEETVIFPERRNRKTGQHPCGQSTNFLGTTPEADVQRSCEISTLIALQAPPALPSEIQLPIRTSVEGTLLGAALGKRPMLAEVKDPNDPVTVAGPNRAETVTTFTSGTPRNDTNIRTLSRGQITGAASGDVQRVETALVRLNGGARAAAARCAWLMPAGNMRAFRPGTGRRCSKPVWIKAKGRKRWRLRLRRKLTKGSYAVYSRAFSRAGVPENRFSRRDKNRVEFRVR